MKRHESGEEIFATSITDKELVSEIYKEFFQLNKRVQTNFRNGHFTKESDISVNKHMKNCLTSVSREMQRETIIRHHYTPIRKTKVKKKTD